MGEAQRQSPVRRTEKEKRMGYTCWECGSKTLYSMPAQLDMASYGWEELPARWYCKECFERKKAEHKKDLEEYLRLKTKIMVERAIKTLEKQRLNVYEYKEAIDAVTCFATENNFGNRRIYACLPKKEGQQARHKDKSSSGVWMGNCEDSDKIHRTERRITC